MCTVCVFCVSVAIRSLTPAHNPRAHQMRKTKKIFVVSSRLYSDRMEGIYNLKHGIKLNKIEMKAKPDWRWLGRIIFTRKLS